MITFNGYGYNVKGYQDKLSLYYRFLNWTLKNDKSFGLQVLELTYGKVFKYFIGKLNNDIELAKKAYDLGFKEELRFAGPHGKIRS